MPRKIILDCDPGQDDAIALILAQGNPEIELLAVTTVGGNQTLEKVTHNALAVATVAGIRDVPIAAGCGRPFVREPMVAGDVHGESGLGGVDLPESEVELDPRHAVDVIIDVVMAHEPGEVTLVPVGPLTNIAMAARKEPRIVERVREVVLMGGGVHTGNRTPVAEFNIACDPESAQVVFSAGWPVTMIGLDVTHQALATDEVAARMGAIGGTSARLAAQVFEFYGEFYRRATLLPHAPLHDPCAVAYVIDPGVMTTRRAPISVELNGSQTSGMTVVDLRAAPDDSCPTQVGVELDTERFWDLIADALTRLA